MYTPAHSERACVLCMTRTPERERIILGVIPRVLSNTGLEFADIAMLFGYHAPASCLVPPPSSGVRSMDHYAGFFVWFWRENEDPRVGTTSTAN